MVLTGRGRDQYLSPPPPPWRPSSQNTPPQLSQPRLSSQILNEITNCELRPADWSFYSIRRISWQNPRYYNHNNISSIVPLRNTRPSYANVYWAVKSYMSRVGFINTLESKLGFPLEPCDYWHDSHICQGFCLCGSQHQASKWSHKKCGSKLPNKIILSAYAKSYLIRRLCRERDILNRFQ